MRSVLGRVFHGPREGIPRAELFHGPSLLWVLLFPRERTEIMLYLLFQLGEEGNDGSRHTRAAASAGRYALEANRVIEVVPLLSLTRIPQAPKGVGGMFVYRGQAVPAIDLCEMTVGRPARERLSTRIIIIDYSEELKSGKNSEMIKAISANPDLSVSAFKDSDSTFSESSAARRPRLLGLIVERATGMMRRDARDFAENGLNAAVAPFLGPVLVDERGVIQLLHAQKLLPENVRDLVFSPREEQNANRGG